MKIEVVVYGVPRENDVVVIDFHFFFLAVARNFAKPNDYRMDLAPVVLKPPEGLRLYGALTFDPHQQAP
jgi:hypothetical protein